MNGRPKDRFYLKGPSLDYNSELSSIDIAWDFSRGHWWDLITFESTLFLESLTVSLCIKYLVQSSKWRAELGVWEVVFFHVPEEIIYSFLIHFGIVQIWPMYHSLDKRAWFAIIFLLFKESLTLFQIWIFYYTFTCFVPFEVTENRVTKVNSKLFNGNCAEA